MLELIEKKKKVGLCMSKKFYGKKKAQNWDLSIEEQLEMMRRPIEVKVEEKKEGSVKEYRTPSFMELATGTYKKGKKFKKDKKYGKNNAFSYLEKSMTNEVEEPEDEGYDITLIAPGVDKLKDKETGIEMGIIQKIDKIMDSDTSNPTTDDVEENEDMDDNTLDVLSNAVKMDDVIAARKGRDQIIAMDEVNDEGEFINNDYDDVDYNSFEDSEVDEEDEAFNKAVDVLDENVFTCERTPLANRLGIINLKDGIRTRSINLNMMDDNEDLDVIDDEVFDVDQVGEILTTTFIPSLIASSYPACVIPKAEFMAKYNMEEVHIPNYEFMFVEANVNSEIPELQNGVVLVYLFSRRTVYTELSALIRRVSSVSEDEAENVSKYLKCWTFVVSRLCLGKTSFMYDHAFSEDNRTDRSGSVIETLYHDTRNDDVRAAFDYVMDRMKVNNNARYDRPYNPTEKLIDSTELYDKLTNAINNICQTDAEHYAEEANDNTTISETFDESELEDFVSSMVAERMTSDNIEEVDEDDEEDDEEFYNNPEISPETEANVENIINNILNNTEEDQEDVVDKILEEETQPVVKEEVKKPNTTTVDNNNPFVIPVVRK